MHLDRPKNWKRIVGGMLCALICMTTGMNAEEPSMETVNRILEQAQQSQSRMEIPKELNTAGEAAAKEAFERFQSKESQEKIESEKERIAGTMLKPLNPEKPSNQEHLFPDRLLNSEKVFLFISSSMPEQTLRAYAQDLDRLGDPNFVLVLRGFVDNMQKARPTLDFLEKLLVRESGCRLGKDKACDLFKVSIVIDPLVFQKFNIQEVPALAFVRNINLVDPKQSLGLAGNLSGEVEAVVVCGDAALASGLEHIFKDTKDARIKQTVRKLQGDFYEG